MPWNGLAECFLGQKQMRPRLLIFFPKRMLVNMTHAVTKPDADSSDSEAKIGVPNLTFKIFLIQSKLPHLRPRPNLHPISVP